MPRKRNWRDSRWLNWRLKPDLCVRIIPGIGWLPDVWHNRKKQYFLVATPLFQHRHYTKIAEIIANLDADIRGRVADHFAINLRGTNPQFSSTRFELAAVGKPVGRDKVR